MLLLLLLLLFAECFIFLVIINKGNKPWMNEKAYTYTCYMLHHIAFSIVALFWNQKKSGSLELWLTDCILTCQATWDGWEFGLESLSCHQWLVSMESTWKEEKGLWVIGEKQSVCVCMIDANPRTFCICTKFPDFFQTQNSNQRYYKSNQILPRFLNNWLYF